MKIDARNSYSAYAYLVRNGEICWRGVGEADNEEVDELVSFVTALEKEKEEKIANCKKTMGGRGRRERET